MLRTAAKKVAWVGRTASMVFGLALVLALLFGVASMALAGTGVNGVFNLGVKNTVDTVTQLVSNPGTGPAGPMLRIDNNNSTGLGATGLQILTEAGKPPMTVNSTTRVTRLNADKIDGKDSTDFASAYKRTVVVSPVPGNATASGTALKNALAGITDASATNPYLLKIEPGIYDVGVAPGLQMTSWVDVEGSGEGITTLTATGNASTQTGTVVGAAHSGLRFLTVKNTGGTSHVSAIYSQANPFRVEHATATASGGDSTNIGVLIAGGAAVLDQVSASASGTGASNTGVFAEGTTTLSQVSATASEGANNTGVVAFGTTTLSQVIASASGNGDNRGVWTQADSTTTLSQVSATASGGTNNFGMDGVGDVEVRNSRLAGNTNTIHNNNGTVRVGASQLDGGAVFTGLSVSLTCAGVFDENYAFFASTCP